MEKSSFFNSVSHDRTYKAEDWAEYFASFIGNGVFPVPSTGLQVVANDGMKLNVKTGKAWINGYFYFNTGDLAVELDTADGQLNRIDRLVNRIQDKAVDIYECVLEANELDLRDAQEYRQRQKLQAKALTYCKELLFFIELSQEMGFISMSSCEYWSKLALEVKYMTTAWKKRDKTRA